MGLVLQVQVIWVLLNLCMVVLGSSGIGEPLSLESNSLIPPIESQVSHSGFEPGLVLKPPTISPSSKLPPLLQNEKGQPPVPTPTQSATPSLIRGLTTSAPTQTSHDSSPPLVVERPHYSTPPHVVESAYAPSTTVSPVDSTPPPVSKLAHSPSTMVSPVDRTPPPVAQAAHAPSAMVLPVDTTPPPVAESAHVPSATVLPVVTTPPPPAESAHGPSHMVLPVDTAPPPVTEPPHAFDIPSVAKPPQVLTSEPPVKTPPYLPTLPLPYESPQHAPIIPVLSPPHQMGPSQVSSPAVLTPSNVFVPPPLMLPFPLEPPPGPPPSLSSPPPTNEPTLYEPPPPAGDTPPFDVSPSNAPSELPSVEPPHAALLPLPANPPLLPVSEPPEALTLTPPPKLQPVLPSLPPISAIQSPPIPPIESSPPIASSPPPQLPSLNASSPIPPLIPQISPPTPMLPPSFSFSPPLMVPPPMDSSPDLPTPSPPIPQNASTLAPQISPPHTSSPPPQLPPLNASSPVPPLIPLISPPTPALPPSSSFPPPLMAPPPVSQNASSLISPPIATSPPPQLVVPPLLSPPTQAFPPSASFSPPLMVPPSVDSPPDLPTPPPHVPQNVSSPPPLLVSPPPASPPTSVLPSIPLVSPPSMMPSPVLPLLSPPMPSQAVSPLPSLAPPHSFSPPLADPPQVFSAPPPIKLPVTSPPFTSTVSGAIPPHASSPPLFLSPPLSSPPGKKGSPGLASPPMTVPSHALFAPPPSELEYPFVPPPAGNRAVPALPPHSSQRKVTQHEAPPPVLTSPEISPPSRAAPPFKQVRPESPPPISQPVEAPKHSASSSRPNASEPHSPPLTAPAPSNKTAVSTAPQPVPPHRAPEQLSPASMAPRHEPEFERQNETAPAPSIFQVIPSTNGSHHSRHRSPGAPMAVTPLPSPLGIQESSPTTSPVPHAPPPGKSQIPFLSPEISPTGSSPRTSKKVKKPLSPPIRSLPPPPPNADCAYITCPAPSTNTPPGSPCGCVWPMQVGIRLSVALYTFFPLVSELAQEIASGTFLKPSQVRVMGANAAAEEPEKTIVLVDLLPLDDKFDNITSHLIFDRFWQKQVVIDTSIFGDYDVLYVRYPGLPPSPPMAPADIAVINGMPYSVRDPNGSKLHPLGVDVAKQRHKHRLNAIIIAVIVLSAVLGVLMCCSVAWVLVFRHTNNNDQPTLTPRAGASLGRSSGPTGLSTGSGQSSPLSLGSSLATYTGSAKTFSGREIEKATDNFNSSRILGEGGFGLVYSGDLDDDTQVAVKVLKRDDQQGGREFLAEVEMLSRLHHRNLVKLIGICTDERMRSLVYELIPNGSVDSHLHGTDKEIAPLDWASRMKIALGAARGLAYLHEDSSPRVIHRDFKSSNILLENDFTPKVSDFGLARSAMDEENQHISTRVMGTFGYVAPEYAMTGHLLVKSDVYSYGVVLLELLTGRKPVDMSMPAGQENLVSWTRPLLTSKEGLESIIDPSLGSQVHFESVAKVAAIASMCVQPEVSHRPFMGEVVQALKLVCTECDDSKDGEDSRSHSRENLSIDFDAKVSSPVSGTQNPLHGHFSLPNYASGHDVEKGLSVSEILCASKSLGEQASDSFRRHSASGPLRTTRGRHFWQRVRRESHGSTSEHGIMYRLWAGSH